jgi:hypothetical protein
MRIVRTIVWLVLLLAFIVFAVNNWRPIEVKVWEGLVLETKIPALLVASFLLGLLPMWLVHRGKVWRLNRRIGILESTAHSAATTLAQIDDQNIVAADPTPIAVPAASPSEPDKPASENP